MLLVLEEVVLGCKRCWKVVVSGDGTSYGILDYVSSYLFEFEYNLEVIYRSCQWFEEHFALFSFESL